MEREALRESEESPPASPQFKRSSSRPISVLVNKRTIIIAAVVVLILLIMVIVLGALLGAERAKQGRTSKTFILFV